MKLYENIKKSLKENELEDTLKSGGVIQVSNDEGWKYSTKYKLVDGVPYFKSREWTGNEWNKHPNQKSLEDLMSWLNANPDLRVEVSTDEEEPKAKESPRGKILREPDMERAKINVRDWYMKEYPTDELGAEIKENLTFEDVFDALDRHQDFYDLIDVGDSIVRERIFKELADIMGTDYDYVYNQWLGESNLKESANSISPVDAFIGLTSELNDGMGDFENLYDYAVTLADTCGIKINKEKITTFDDALNIIKKCISNLYKEDTNKFKEEVDNLMYAVIEEQDYLADTLQNREDLLKYLEVLMPYTSDKDAINNLINSLQTINVDLRATAEEFQRYLHDNFKPWTVLGTTSGPRTYINLFEVPTDYEVVSADYFNYANRPNDMLENIGYGWKQTDNGIQADLIGFTTSSSGSAVHYDIPPVLYGYSAIITPENKDEKFKEMADALIKKASELKKQFGLKESAGYSDKLGGDPEDFISDMIQIKSSIERIDTEEFGTKLAKQIIDDFIETCESQIEMTRNKYNINESDNEEPTKQLWVYVSKHGLGPGTIPNDVEAQYVTSLPDTGKDIFSVSRELTPEELNKYELALFDNKYFAKYPEVLKELFSLNTD